MPYHTWRTSWTTKILQRRTRTGTELFQCRNKQVKVPGSPSSHLTPCLQPLKTSEQSHLLPGGAKDNSSCKGQSKSEVLYLSKTSATADHKKWKCREKHGWCESMNLITSPNEPAPFCSQSSVSYHRCIEMQEQLRSTFTTHVPPKYLLWTWWRFTTLYSCQL